MSVLWKDKYKNVFQGGSAEQVREVVGMLALIQGSVLYSDNLLAHLGAAEIRLFGTPEPEFSLLMRNARENIVNAAESLQNKMRALQSQFDQTLIMSEATLEACSRFSIEVAVLVGDAERINAEALRAVQAYLDAHPEAINMVSTDFSLTLLHEAACSGLFGVTRLLLQRGANRSALNRMGQTAAERCRALGHTDLATLIDEWP